MSTTDLSKLEQDAQKGQAKYEEARQRADRAEAEALEEYQRRASEWDRRELEAFDEEELRRSTTEAEGAFVAALLEEPWVRKWIEWRARDLYRWQRTNEAANLAQRFDSRRVFFPEVRDASLV